MGRLRRLVGGQAEERLRRSDVSSPLWSEHLSRYVFVSHHAATRVLDVACGAGIGFEALPGRSVVGGDRSRDALIEAADTAVEVSLCQLDASSLPFRDDAFDQVACFETIEHVEDDRGLVREIGRVLSADGVAFISTPVRGYGSVDGERSANPFHLQEYSVEELTDLLRPVFARVELLGQRPTAAFARNGFWSPATDPWTRVRRGALKAALRLPLPLRRTIERARGTTLFPGIDDFEFSADAVRAAPVLLAVCRH